jgi:chloramphenicol O-acetyltransferase type A
MRQIDLQTWPRAEHFEVYNRFDYPHFNLCANVDLSVFTPYVKDHGISFNIAVVYVLARAANAIPEFRYRIRSGEVVEHEVVHPSTTILAADDLFSFCTIDYSPTFSVFEISAVERIAIVKDNRVLNDEPGQDDLLFMTAIPWVSFTSFMHPLHFHPVDSVPRLAWGKFYEENGSMKMPLSVQGHHALMDALHVGRYYELVQGYFREPGDVLGKD